MALRALHRWLLVACCAVVALVAARPAQAAAPICDERGASAIAPPPILPVRDDQLDVGVPLPLCLEIDLALASGPGSDSVRTQVPQESSVDACFAPSLSALSAPTAGRAPLEADGLERLPAGFPPGVFHPPRV